MKKILLTLTLLTHISFAATSEQIEQYLTVSNAEEQLLAMQAQYSSMQRSFAKDTNSSENNYDMQLLSIRFKDYLSKKLSEDEMNEVLENYKNVILLQFVSAESGVDDLDENTSKAYLEKIKSDPEAGTRIQLIENISKALYAKDSMIIMFDELIFPMMQKSNGKAKMDDKMTKAMKDSYSESMEKSSKDSTLLTCKDFTMTELEELLKIAQTPAIQHEVKAVFGAMAYSLKEFFMSLASRYDSTKHQPQAMQANNQPVTNKTSSVAGAIQ